MARPLAIGVATQCLAPLKIERFSVRLYSLIGVNSVFLPDHYVGFVPRAVWTPLLCPAANDVPSTDAFFDPFVMMGMIAARHPRLRIGTGVTEAFRRHPVTLAQAFVTLDHLTKGRAIFGIGNGERENTEPYGIPFTKRVARLEEALTLIRTLWQSKGEPIDFDGNFWRLRKAIFATPLYKDAAPPVWIAAHAPKMLGLTARFGDGWLPTQKMTAQEYGAKLSSIHEVARKHGRNIHGFEAGMQSLVAVGKNPRDTALQLLRIPACIAMSMLMPGAVWEKHNLKHPLGNDFEGFADFVPEEITPDHLAAAGQQVTPELLQEGMHLGSIRDIVAQARDLVDAGMRHLVLWNVGPLATGATPTSVMQFVRLIWKLQRLKLK